MSWAFGSSTDAVAELAALDAAPLSHSLKQPAPPPMDSGTLLPSPGRSRSLMRAVEAQALVELRGRSGAFDNELCVQLAESEAALLVDLDAALSTHGAPTTTDARELLRAPLDGLSTGTRALAKRRGADEADAIKRSLAVLASDLTAVHETELRRVRDSLAHAKRQANGKLETIRRSMQTQLAETKENLRRDCEARVAEAQRLQREAEARAAAALEKHPVVDAPALIEERAELRVKVEMLASQLSAAKAEAEVNSTRQADLRYDAERRAAQARRQLDDTSATLDKAKAQLAIANEQKVFFAGQLDSSRAALEASQAEVASLKTRLMASKHQARGDSAKDPGSWSSSLRSSRAGSGKRGGGQAAAEAAASGEAAGAAPLSPTSAAATAAVVAEVAAVVAFGVEDVAAKETAGQAEVVSPLELSSASGSVLPLQQPREVPVRPARTAGADADDVDGSSAAPRPAADKPAGSDLTAGRQEPGAEDHEGEGHAASQGGCGEVGGDYGGDDGGEGDERAFFIPMENLDRPSASNVPLSARAVAYGTGGDAFVAAREGAWEQWLLGQHISGSGAAAAPREVSSAPGSSRRDRLGLPHAKASAASPLYALPESPQQSPQRPREAQPQPQRDSQRRTQREREPQREPQKAFDEAEAAAALAALMTIDGLGGTLGTTAPGSGVSPPAAPPPSRPPSGRPVSSRPMSVDEPGGRAARAQRDAEMRQMAAGVPPAATAAATIAAPTAALTGWEQDDAPPLAPTLPDVGGAGAASSSVHVHVPMTSCRRGGRPASSSRPSSSRPQGSPPQVRPRGTSRAAAVSRQPCASLPNTLRRPNDVERSYDANEGLLSPRKPGGAAAGSFAEEATPRGASRGPPVSLMEKMRQRQAVLESMMDARTSQAMVALANNERTFPAAYNVAATSAAAAAADARRLAVEREPFGVVLDPDRSACDGLVAHSSAKGSDARAGVQRRERTFVGLNFVR